MTENILEEIKRIAGEKFDVLEKHIQKATGVGDTSSYNSAMTVLRRLENSAGAEDKKTIEKYAKIVTAKYYEALFD